MICLHKNQNSLQFTNFFSFVVSQNDLIETRKSDSEVFLHLPSYIYRLVPGVRFDTALMKFHYKIEHTND